MDRLATVVARTIAFSFAFLIAGGHAAADVVTFTDRAAFLAALGSSPLTDDYESYGLGDIANGSTLGDFVYDFTATQPAVVAGGYGGQALGGPFDVFVGGDLVTLSFTGLSGLQAFGADFYYAPSFDAIPSDLYRLRVEDGSGAGTFVGNPDTIDPFGGTFFLGLIATPGFEFSAVSILSVVPTDGNGEPTYLVPAYQVDNLAYQGRQAVPEPSSLSLLLIGAGFMRLVRATGRT